RPLADEAHGLSLLANITRRTSVRTLALDLDLPADLARGLVERRVTERVRPYRPHPKHESVGCLDRYAILNGDPERKRSRHPSDRSGPVDLRCPRADQEPVEGLALELELIPVREVDGSRRRRRNEAL